MEQPRRRHHGGLVGPTILIGLGVLLLLNTLHIVSWSIWEMLLRLWPVLLIGWGLELLLGRRSIWGSLLAVVLTLAILAGAAWLMVGRVGGEPLPGEEVAQPSGQATEATVVLMPAVGELHVSAAPASSPNLLEGTVRPLYGEQVVQDVAQAGGTLSVTLRSTGTSFMPAVGGTGEGWNLQLNPNLPLRLSTAMGAGYSELRLTGLTLKDLNVSTGIGETRVILPAEGRFRAEVDGAIGQITIVVPAGLGVRVVLDTALVSWDTPADFRCEEDICTSPGYEEATNRVDLEVGMAIGSVTIQME
jgi:hypothetical protein